MFWMSLSYTTAAGMSSSLTVSLLLVVALADPGHPTRRTVSRNLFHERTRRPCDHNTIERVARRGQSRVCDSSRDFGPFQSAVETLDHSLVFVSLTAVRQADPPCLLCINLVLTSFASFRFFNEIFFRDFDRSRECA